MGSKSGMSAKRKREEAQLAEIKALKKTVQEQEATLKQAKAAIEDGGEMNFCAAEINPDSDNEFWDNMAMSATEGVRFKVDSGASYNFANNEVPSTDAKPCNSIVEIADGSPVHIAKKAKFNGTTSDGTKLSFGVKHSEKFSQNLFSVPHAAKHGNRIVLDDKESYIENKLSKNRIPLQRTSNGWDLLLKPAQ